MNSAKENLREYLLYESYKNICMTGWRYIAVINQWKGGLGDSGAGRGRGARRAAWRAARPCHVVDDTNRMHTQTRRSF